MYADSHLKCFNYFVNFLHKIYNSEDYTQVEHWKVNSLHFQGNLRANTASTGLFLRGVVLLENIIPLSNKFAPAETFSSPTKTQQSALNSAQSNICAVDVIVWSHENQFFIFFFPFTRLPHFLFHLSLSLCRSVFNLGCSLSFTDPSSHRLVCVGSIKNKLIWS